jgi:hypothetical protein
MIAGRATERIAERVTAKAGSSQRVPCFPCTARQGVGSQAAAVAFVIEGSIPVG